MFNFIEYICNTIVYNLSIYEKIIIYTSIYSTINCNLFMF